MVWLFSKSKKKIDTPQNSSQILKTQNKNKIQQQIPTSFTFRNHLKISLPQIQANVFKSCVNKCLKQNNSSLSKADGLHIALYHCIQFCGQKWQNAIQIAKQE